MIHHFEQYDAEPLQGDHARRPTNRRPSVKVSHGAEKGRQGKTSRAPCLNRSSHDARSIAVRSRIRTQFAVECLLMRTN